MDIEPIDPLEHTLAQSPPSGAPVTLRGPILAAMQRELAAQRRDWRIGQIAVALVVLGIGLNIVVGLQSMSVMHRSGELAVTSEAIVNVATAVAKATDAETGSRMAQHLAALSGMTLTKDQTAAIQQAIKPPSRNSAAGQDKG